MFQDYTPSKTISLPSAALNPILFLLESYFIVDDMYPNGYNKAMIEIRKTEVYANWLTDLKDIHGKARILVRVERLASGNPGDVKPVGEGVSELRINYGPGYRVYYKKQGQKIIILLAGGNKSTQTRDIKIALNLAHNL